MQTHSIPIEKSHRLSWTCLWLSYMRQTSRRCCGHCQTHREFSRTHYMCHNEEISLRVPFSSPIVSYIPLARRGGLRATRLSINETIINPTHLTTAPAPRQTQSDSRSFSSRSRLIVFHVPLPSPCGRIQQTPNCSKA